jgi:T-complex protein 1 subunit gamma
LKLTRRLTNDGHAILREIDVAHPAAKSMIELSRTQDEEVGDGTTSVIILAGEILAYSLPLLERNIHPVVIIRAFKAALEDALATIQKISVSVDISSETEMLSLIKTSIGTKMVSAWSDLMCRLALDAVKTVAVTAEQESGYVGASAEGGATLNIKTVDIKRDARVEKVPGGEIEDSRVLQGVMINKDITHPKMRRRIDNPRIVLLDCPLEYKKGESQTNIEISKEEDWSRFLQIEEEQIKAMCDKIIEFKPDLVITEKGVSDLAQHYFLKADPPITAIRRVRKSDNNRIARATGATIVNRVEDLRDTDVGTGCGLFHIEKLGDEYFTFLEKCTAPKACTILLRGPSKDILNEIDRNLADAMSVARNVVFNPLLAPGGGATEMAISVALTEKAKSMPGVAGAPYKAIAEALEVIPRTLIQNCGGNAMRALTELRAKHAQGEHMFGIDGDTGKVTDMQKYGLLESSAVKIQTIKTAIESATLLLRIDDILKGSRGPGAAGEGVQTMGEAAEDLQPDGMQL